MLKSILGAIGVAATLLLAATASAQTAFRPVAVVNDSVITAYDIVQRAQLMGLLGFPAPSPEALQAAALDRLIEDRLKLLEAKRQGVTPTPEMIVAGVEELATSAKVTPEEFRSTVTGRGVGAQTLDDMVGAEMVWREVVRRQFARRVDPTDAEIDAEIGLLQQQARVSYRLSELGLPFTDRGRTRAQTRALADRLYGELSAGADFGAAARKYSRSPSAARGGDVGWVPANRLPPEVAGAVAGIEIGQVTRPIEVSGGLTILKIADRRDETVAGVDAADPELRERIRRKLTNEQTGRLADGLLQELRRDALIEMR